MAAERSDRRFFLKGVLGGGFLSISAMDPSVEMSEDLADRARVLRERAIGAVLYGLKTRDAQYLTTLTEDNFYWGIYGGGNRFNALSENNTIRMFESAMRNLDTESCLRFYKYLPEKQEVQLVINGLTLRQIDEEKRVSGISILKMVARGDFWIISGVEEIPTSTWNDTKFYNELDASEACPTEYGYPVRSFRARKGELVHPVSARIDETRHTTLVYLPGMTTYIEDGGAGIEGSRMFLPFQQRVHKYGITAPYSINMSWGGFRIGLENGLYYPGAQNCLDTLTDPRERYHVLKDFVLWWFSQHPNHRLIIHTHSEGSQPALLLLADIKHEIIKYPNYPIKPDMIDFVFTHAPALGVDKPAFEVIAKIPGIRSVPEDCRVIFNKTPALGILNQPVSKYLLQIWDNRREFAKQVETDVLWWRALSGRVISIGNYQDQAFSIKYGSLNRFVLEGLARVGLFPEIILTQKVPGAEAYMYYLGHEGFGHVGVWRAGAGMSLMEEFVKNRIEEYGG